MSTKMLFKLGIAFGAVALLLVFLGLYFVPRASAGNKAITDKVTRLAAAGVIQRLPSNYYINSDWIERHPVSSGLNAILGQSSNYYLNSDWIDRHPSNYYAGSDWTERHPASGGLVAILGQSSNYYLNSDWIDRHPSNYYTGSDWIERHPASPEK